MSRFGDHPYLTTSFWMEPKHQYWERDLYSLKTKEEMRQWLAEKVKGERQIAALQKSEPNKNNFA